MGLDDKEPTGICTRPTDKADILQQCYRRGGKVGSRRMLGLEGFSG